MCFEFTSTVKYMYLSSTCPWAGNVRVRWKREVGAKCVFVYRRMQYLLTTLKSRNLYKNQFFTVLMSSRWANFVRIAQWAESSFKIRSLACFYWNTNTKSATHFFSYISVICMCLQLFWKTCFHSIHTWLKRLYLYTKTIVVPQSYRLRMAWEWYFIPMVIYCFTLSRHEFHYIHKAIASFMAHVIYLYQYL